MEFINISDKSLRFGGNRKGLLKMIVLPDYCPGKGALPVGLVAVYDRNNHKISAEYLGPDVGCGMTLARFRKPLQDLEHVAYSVTQDLREVKTELGSLGSGNHFIDIFKAEEVNEEIKIKKGDYLVLVHSGSRLQGQRVCEKGLSGKDYLGAYKHLIDFGRLNRDHLLDLVRKVSKDKLEVILDDPHNTLEVSGDEVLYRKGAIKIHPGEISVIPSSMGGEAILVKGKPALAELEFSMCHGTGRKISRGEAKNRDFNFDALRRKICIPTLIPNWEIKTETPNCYRTIEEILPAIEKYVEIVGILTPKAYSS